MTAHGCAVQRRWFPRPSSVTPLSAPQASARRFAEDTGPGAAPSADAVFDDGQEAPTGPARRSTRRLTATLVRRSILSRMRHRGISGLPWPHDFSCATPTADRDEERTSTCGLHARRLRYTNGRSVRCTFRCGSGTTGCADDAGAGCAF